MIVKKHRYMSVFFYDVLFNKVMSMNFVALINTIFLWKKRVEYVIIGKPYGGEAYEKYF